MKSCKHVKNHVKLANQLHGPSSNKWYSWRESKDSSVVHHCFAFVTIGLPYV
jgi:hypothetical protein